jgi:two-component system alkaline phosphatase synthesis response regulator PhoP
MKLSVLVLGTAAEQIGTLLRQQGVLVELSPEPKTGLSDGWERTYNLIIYSCHSTSVELFDFCIALQNRNRTIPLVIAAQHSTLQDRVLALEIGADDFLTLELPEIELRARLAALLRRLTIDRNLRSPTAERRIFKTDELEIDLDQKQARLAGKPLGLSPTEYSILETLALHPGKTISRSTLSDSLWGYDSDVYDDNIKWHICRLRKKLNPTSSAPEYIATVRNRGYRLLSSAERKFHAMAA